MMYLLAGVTDSTMNTNPATNTAASACWKVYPIPNTTPKVKNALSPIPGASATGQFAHSPIINVPTTAAMIVAVNTALEDEPELLNESPQDRGWLCKVSNIREQDLDSLMTEDAYKAFLGSDGAG